MPALFTNGQVTMMLLVKLAIIATITAIAFTLASYLLWLSDSWPMQAAALAVWLCGAVLSIYLTWRLEIRRGL